MCYSSLIAGSGAAVMERPKSIHLQHLFSCFFSAKIKIRNLEMLLFVM
jgi:hypothetical protein